MKIKRIFKKHQAEAYCKEEIDLNLYKRGHMIVIRVLFWKPHRNKVKKCKIFKMINLIYLVSEFIIFKKIPNKKFLKQQDKNQTIVNFHFNQFCDRNHNLNLLMKILKLS